MHWTPVLLLSLCRRVLIGLTLVALSSPNLFGQSSNSPMTVTQSNAIQSSGRLRLQTATALKEGRLVLNTADSLGISDEEGDLRVLRLAVDSVWVRRHNALAGFLAGTATGAVAYYLTTKEEYDGSDTQELDNLIGAGVWAGSALVGTLVGMLIPRWKRVYP
jgi:hypothetical protein